MYVGSVGGVVRNAMLVGYGAFAGLLGHGGPLDGLAWFSSGLMGYG